MQEERERPKEDWGNESKKVQRKETGGYSEKVSQRKQRREDQRK